jgi:Tfp pilus assembly protein PilN
MIEINLLPQELRYVEKEKSKVPVEWSRLLLIVPACAGLLVCVQICLGIGGAMRARTLKRLTREWAGLDAERKRIQEYDLEYASVTQQVDKVRTMAARRVLWGEKLKALSRHLPPGVWFTDMSVSGGEFSLQGSVLSFEADEMLHIRQLIDGLHADKEFIADFQEFQLSSVQKRTVGAYDIADFTVTGRLRQEGK